jgi:hypothetical protein
VPVLVATPAPSRLNHASRVNVAEPRPGACPSATIPEVPLRSTAVLLDAGLTVMVTVSLPVSAPSLAVSLSRYEPGDEKVAVVLNSCGWAMLTVPGPLTTLHVVPRRRRARRRRHTCRRARRAAGNVTVWSGPAFAVGARFTWPIVTSIVTLEVADSSPSLPVSISTYDPGVEKPAVVIKDVALPKVTVPGPLTLVQRAERGVPVLMPSVSVIDPPSEAVAGICTAAGPVATTTGGRFGAVNSGVATPRGTQLQPSPLTVPLGRCPVESTTRPQQSLKLQRASSPNALGISRLAAAAICCGLRP